MPLDFTFTEEQEIFGKTFREYLAKNVVPRSKEMLEARMLTPEVHRALVDFGFPGLLLSEEWGGANADFITFTIAVEELARADQSGFAGDGTWYGAVCAKTIESHGTPQLKEEVLPNVVKKGWMTPLHSTEPGCGTDFTRIETIADKKNGEYVVNGEKLMVSGVPGTLKYGGGFLTTVNTNPEFRKRGRGMSLLYIPIGEGGLPYPGAIGNGITTTRFEGMGVDLGGVRYEATRVPEYCLIGAEGLGVPLTTESFARARIPTAMVQIAATEFVIEQGMEYIKQRKAFGRPVGGFEGIQFELAEDYARVQAAKLMCYRAAWMMDLYLKGRGKIEDVLLAGSLCRAIATDDCLKAVSDVLEWYGGIGTTAEYPIQRTFNLVRQLGIAEGTRHAQKIVVALGLLGSEFAAWRKWE